jgi:hypothetical protein
MSGRPFGFMRRLSLKWRLSISFAGIAILTAGVIGAVLIPILSSHYRGAEETYLEAAAERAVRDLSALSWKKNSIELASAAKGVALVTQARVILTDPSGAVVADSGSPWTVDASGLLAPPSDGSSLSSPSGQQPGTAQPATEQPVAAQPLGRRALRHRSERRHHPPL